VTIGLFDEPTFSSHRGLAALATLRGFTDEADTACRSSRSADSTDTEAAKQRIAAQVAKKNASTRGAPPLLPWYLLGT
jgi:hypothetical protein